MGLFETKGKNYDKINKEYFGLLFGNGVGDILLKKAAKHSTLHYLEEI